MNTPLQVFVNGPQTEKVVWQLPPNDEIAINLWHMAADLCPNKANKSFVFPGLQVDNFWSSNVKTPSEFGALVPS